MSRTYRYTVNGRNFLVYKDYFDRWVIFSADDKFLSIIGAPPFSTGFRTKREALEFLDKNVKEQSK